MRPIVVAQHPPICDKVGRQRPAPTAGHGNLVRQHHDSKGSAHRTLNGRRGKQLCDQLPCQFPFAQYTLACHKSAAARSRREDLILYLQLIYGRTTPRYCAPAQDTSSIDRQRAKENTNESARRRKSLGRIRVFEACTDDLCGRFSETSVVVCSTRQAAD